MHYQFVRHNCHARLLEACHMAHAGSHAGSWSCQRQDI
jgi:hypothetical protein